MQYKISLYNMTKYTKYVINILFFPVVIIQNVIKYYLLYKNK